MGDFKRELFIAENTVRENVLACNMHTDTVVMYQVAYGQEVSLTKLRVWSSLEKKKSLSPIFTYNTEGIIIQVGHKPAFPRKSPNLILGSIFLHS